MVGVRAPRQQHPQVEQGQTGRGRERERERETEHEIAPLGEAV